jgi:hypothetical protein
MRLNKDRKRVDKIIGIGNAMVTIKGGGEMGVFLFPLVKCTPLSAMEVVNKVANGTDIGGEEANKEVGSSVNGRIYRIIF